MDDMNNPTPQALGISGRIAALFQSAQITPLLALVAFLLGVFAVMVTPREEEPQINVTMANVLIPFPGASVADVEQMVATPAEQVLSQTKQDKLIGSFLDVYEAAAEVGKICNSYQSVDIDFTVLLTHIGFEADKELAAILAQPEQRGAPLLGRARLPQPQPQPLPGRLPWS